MKRLPLCFDAVADVMACYHALNKQLHLFPLYSENAENSVALQLLDEFSLDSATFPVRWFLQIVNSTGQMKPPSDEILEEFYSYELNLAKNRLAKLVISKEMEQLLPKESKQTLVQSLPFFLEKYRAIFKHFGSRFSKILSFIGSDLLYGTLGLDLYSLAPSYPIELFKDNAIITGFPSYFKAYGLYENLNLLTAVQDTILEKFPFPNSDLKTYPLTLSLTNSSIGANKSFVDVLTRAIRRELVKGDIMEARRLGGMIPAWFPYALLANMELIYCEQHTELLEYPMKIFPRFKKDFEIVRVISPDEPITCLYNNSIPALLQKHHKLSVAQMVNFDNDKFYLMSEETRDTDFDFLKAFHIFRLMFGIAEYPLDKFNAGIAIITKLLDGMVSVETRKCIVIDMFSCLFLKKKNSKEFIFSTIQARIIIELLNKYDASDYIARANDLISVSYQMDKLPQFGVFLIKDPIFILQALAANDWKLADHLALMLPSYRRDLNLKMMVNNLVTYNIQPTEQQDMVYAEAGFCYPELSQKLSMIESADPVIWELIDLRKDVKEDQLMEPILPSGDLSKYKMYSRFSALIAEYKECNGTYEFNVPTAMLRAIRNDKIDVMFKWLRAMNVDPYEYLFSNASRIDLETLSESFKQEHLSEYKLEMKAYEMSRTEKPERTNNHENDSIKKLVDALRADTLTSDLIDDLVYQIEPKRIIKELLIVKDEIWNDSVQLLVDLIDYAADSLEKEQLRRHHKGSEYMGDGGNRERFAQGSSNLTREDILGIRKENITEDLKRQLMAFVTDSYDLVLVKRVCELLDVNVSPVIEHKFNDYIKKIVVKDKASEYQTYVHIHRFTKYLSDPKKAEALCEFFMEGVFTRYGYEYSLVNVKSIPRVIIGICFKFDLQFTAYKISEAFNLDYRQYALNIIHQEIRLGFYEDARANYSAFRKKFKNAYVEDYQPFDSSLMEDKSSGPQSTMLKKKDNTSEPSVVSNFMVRKQMLDGLMTGQTNTIRRPSVPRQINSLHRYDDLPSSLPDNRRTSFRGHGRTFVCPFSDWTSVPFFDPLVRKSLWNLSVIEELQRLDFSRKKFLHMSKDSQVMKMKELKYYTVHCTSTYVALPLLASLQMFDVAYQMLLNISESSTQEYSFVHYFFLPSIAFRGQHAMKKFILSQDQLLLLTGSLWVALETYCYEHKMHNTLLSIYTFKNQLDDAAYLALSLYKKSNTSIAKRITHLGDAFNHLQESIKYRTNQSQSAIPPIVLSDATTEEIQQMADRVLIQLDFCQMCMLEHIEITPSMDIVYNDANGPELAAYALTRNKLRLLETVRAKIPIDMQRAVNRAIELIADHKMPEIQKLMDLVKTHYGEYYDNFFRHALNAFALRRNIREIVALIVDTFTDPSEIAVWFLEHDFLIEATQYATDAKNTALMPLIAKRATELGLNTPVNLIMKYLSRK